ncbi:DapH/DapD/GlmU-related protein [Phocaeicola salanitronis]|nr:DapH/DapD/GlmU-related protein [Phocaeicola salanitronis]
MMIFNPIQTNAMPLKDKLKNMVWRIVNKTLFRFTPPYLSLFRKWRVLLVRLFGGQVDWNASLHPTAVIDYPWNLMMREKASLGEKCWVYAMAPISIGELTCIGKDVYLLTGSHDIEKSTFDLVTKPIKIGKGCWIATAATVLPGIAIGDYCVVAANSVVIKNVEACSVVGGNPAKFIKKRIIK